MKKLLIILFMFLIGLTGCKTIEPVDDTDYATIELIEMEIMELPSPLDESSREKVEYITELLKQLSEKEIALIENYEIYENAVNYFKAIDEEKAAISDMFQELETYYTNAIPDIVEGDLDFPSKHETKLGEVSIIWGSSDYNTINSKGVVIRPRKLTRVTLTVTFVYGAERHSFNKVVSVKSMDFTPLPEKAQAIAYMTVNSSFVEFNPVVRETLDIVNYSFASIVNGQISVLSLGNLTNLLKEREKGTRVLFSIGPYGADFEGPASTAAGREKLAQSIVDTVTKYHFDGVDIDWEVPNAATKNNFTLLVKEISTRLKLVNKNYLVTAAVASASFSGYDFPELNKYLDAYNIMTYDLNASNRVTHNSGLYLSNNTAASYAGHQAVSDYIARGVDPSKIVLGAAFYGKRYQLTNPKGAIIGKTVEGTVLGTINYSSIKSSYLNRLGNGVTRYWDDVSKVPYLHDAENGVVVVYEDAESIAAKCQYVLDNNLRGLMFWQLNQDANNDLITSININLTKKR